MVIDYIFVVKRKAKKKSQGIGCCTTDEVVKLIKIKVVKRPIRKKRNNKKLSIQEAVS